MRLWLSPEQAKFIARQTLEAKPEESCGLIAGVGERAERIIPIPNRAERPHTQFRLDERAFIKAVFTIEAEGLALIGIYHSHPTGDPIPSLTDVAQAAYPDTAYLIVGLRGSEPSMAAWQMRYGEVLSVDLHIGLDAPAPEEPPLSNAQKRAILAAALFAFVFMLILSLSLLPPAPVIVTP